MSDYILSADHHAAIMRTSRGITLNTSQSFVPYDINIVPANEFTIVPASASTISKGIDTVIITKGVELKTIRNEGTVGDIVNNNGTIRDIDNRGELH